MALQVITAPSIEVPKYTSIFLAGGITNCHEWQNEVIKEFESICKDRDITLFNPRQENFDIHKENAAADQIKWEFERLEKMDIFSMYFCAGESDQPICMYELGRNIARMQMRFPNDWEHRIVISVEDGYKRKQDVLYQTMLAAYGLWVDTGTNPRNHVKFIISNIEALESRYQPL